MKITRGEMKSSTNRIAQATGADKGILQTISDNVNNGDIKELSVNILEDYPYHKFEIYKDEYLKALADDIKMNGLLQPILVWEHDNHYYILSGHNRTRACKIAGLKKITCIIKKYENVEQANIAVISTNLQSRGGFEALSIQEKINVITQAFDSLKKLYKENKEKYGISEVLGFDAKNEITIYYNLKSSQASTYYKIGKNFKKEWLDLIPKHFNIKTAFQLAHLNKDNLSAVINEIIDDKEEANEIVKVSEFTAKEMRQAENDGEDIENIKLKLYSSKKDKEKKKSYTLKFEDDEFKPYLKKVEKLSDDILKSIFSKALSDYFNKNK